MIVILTLQIKEVVKLVLQLQTSPVFTIMLKILNAKWDFLFFTFWLKCPRRFFMRQVQVVDIYKRNETKSNDTATFHRVQKSNKYSCSQSRNEKDSRTKQELQKEHNSSLEVTGTNRKAGQEVKRQLCSFSVTSASHAALNPACLSPFQKSLLCRDRNHLWRGCVPGPCLREKYVLGPDEMIYLFFSQIQFYSFLNSVGFFFFV